jgi:hypothetical protein
MIVLVGEGAKRRITVYARRQPPMAARLEVIKMQVMAPFPS